MTSMKKAALYTFAGTVVLGVMLSILAILSGTWSWFEVRVILTLYTVSGASICALACVALWEREPGHPLAGLGLALTLTGAVLMVLAIWTDAADLAYGKLTFSIVLFAIASGHLCLLSLARLSPQFRWAPIVAYVAIYGVAGTVTWMIWAEEGSLQTFQLLGILAIVVAGVTILIPIFHALSKPTAETAGPTGTDGTARAARAASRPAPVAVTCPCCGAAQTHELGEITCRQCASVFAVRVIHDSRAGN